MTNESDGKFIESRVDTSFSEFNFAESQEVTLTGGADAITFPTGVTIANDITVYMRSEAGIPTANTVVIKLYSAAGAVGLVDTIPLIAGDIQWHDDKLKIMSMTLTGTNTQKVIAEIKGNQ